MTPEEVNAEVLECARYGEDEDLRALLVGGGAVNHKDAAGNTAVHKASANGEVGCLRVLKEFGAEFCANAEGNLPTHWAAQNAKAEALRFLIDNYGDLVDVLAQNKFGRSTLTEAFNSQNEEVIELCLSHPSASEDRLVPKSGTAAVEEGLQEMDLSSSPSADPTSQLASHAVLHTMALGSGAEPALLCRELPITRADNPFGSDAAPEDDTTGLGLWPAAVLAARWAAGELREALRGKVVIELGCGCGLPGLAAARYSSPSAVHLTDVNPSTLQNAAHNVQINSPGAASASASASDAGAGGSVFEFGRQGAVDGQVQGLDGAAVPVSVSRVSWTDAATYPPLADVLLGSDLVYDATILAALTQAVTGMLAPGGVFYYIAPDEGRAGMDGLVASLAAQGVACVDCKPCPDELFANPLRADAGLAEAEAAGDAFVLHFYDLAAKKPHTCFTFRRA